MKIIRSNNKDIAAGCMDCFGLQPPSALTVVRRKKFLTRYNANVDDNIVRKIEARRRNIDLSFMLFFYFLFDGYGTCAVELRLYTGNIKNQNEIKRQ
jgi:hypothetical protein